MSRRQKIHYAGLDDPRAALAELIGTDQYLLSLQRRFHISTSAYQAIADIRAAMRAAALLLTNDPYFFGLAPAGQNVYRPPPAPRVSGRPMG